MLCEICSEKQSSYIISTVIGSNLAEFRVCDDCAIGNISSKLSLAKKDENLCPNCHCGFYKFSGYSTTLTLLGCPKCYESFHDQLIPLLRKIHGNIRHKGKSISKEKDSDQNGFNGNKAYFSHSPIITKDAKWMQDSGPDSDVVVSSRIRLARNLDGFLFCGLADQAELIEISAKVESASISIAKAEQSPLHDAYIIDLEDLDEIDCGFLMERHLISRDLAEKYIARKVIIDEKENISIMINEEDHIRLQAIDSGLQIDKLWNFLSAIDDDLGKKVNYSFSPDMGFLTACPTNVGTGLRVSVMFHLPALSITKRGKNILASIANMGYAIRGMYGEGSKMTGSFYQISNDATLGQSEEEIIDRIQAISLQILSHEREERQSLLKQDRIRLENAVFRSYGILVNARTISSTESLELISWVSLGVSLGLICNISQNDIAKLLILTRPAHLQKKAGEKQNSTIRDINRANLIRKALGVSVNK